jgi:hypothetical protein
MKQLLLVQDVGDSQAYVVYSEPTWHDTSKLLTVDDERVSVDDLIGIWEQRLEGENYHSMMSIPGSFVGLMRTHDVPDATIKKMLWSIIDSENGWI